MSQYGLFEISDRKTPLHSRRGRVFMLLQDGGWHTTASICSPQFGGTEGTRRLRELRKIGYQIEKRRYADQYEYRMITR